MLSYRIVGCGTLLLASVFFSSGFAAEDERAKSLAEIRSAAAGRDIPGAKTALRDAAGYKGENPKFDAELARLDELVNYLEQFWRAVEKGAASLDAVEELEIDGKRVAVVEASGAKIILRVAGQNKTYTPRDVPPRLAIAFADRVLKKDAAANKVILGAFLALDGKGDVKKAREYWDEAAKAGADVKPLLPELTAARPAPPVEIPALTPPQRQMLDPKQWSLRTKGDKGWVRHSLESAKQSEEGRLNVQVPADAGDAQLLSKRTLAGDFTCRIILKDLPAEQRVGFVPATTDDSGFFVAVPAGTSYVQMSRRGTTISAKIGESDAELQIVGKPAERMSGAIVVTVSGGSSVTIAAVDFAGR